MDLYNSILQRKSCRKYDMQPLIQETLDEMERAIQGFDTLYSDVSLEYRLVEKVKGQFVVDAPHFLIISGQGKQGEMESAGFLFQQLVLWFDAMDIGSVWLGSAKDSERSKTNGHIVTIAFGRGIESVHRTKKDFTRKPIEKIANEQKDICIQAAHMAPSGMNTQPWYFEKIDEEVLVYKRKLKPPISLIYKLSDVDMGIALCHYALACKKLEKPFTFSRNNLKEQNKSGLIPFGVIR